jgi:hypothetical protein
VATVIIGNHGEAGALDRYGAAFGLPRAFSGTNNFDAESADGAAANKVVEVDVNYRFVYPVEPPGAPADRMRVVGGMYGPIYFGDFTQRGTSLQPWVLYFTDRAGGRCDVTDGYVHPDFPSGPPDNSRVSGPAINPYSTATSVPGGGARCGNTTGT